MLLKALANTTANNSKSKNIVAYQYLVNIILPLINADDLIRVINTAKVKVGILIDDILMLL